jgi:phage/plasmid-associated DNA primase
MLTPEMTTEMATALPLSLRKRESVLDGMVMFEKVPLERLQAIARSDILYPSEKEQIAAYIKLYQAAPLGGVTVKYAKAKHKWGRAYPTKHLGLTQMRRAVRNTLIDGLYYDCDLKNAQPEIIRNLCESNLISCPMIKRYCDDRSAVLDEVKKSYGVDRDAAKQLFNRLCFCGTFEGWCRQFKVAKPELEFIALFTRELRDIGEQARKVNADLWNTARKLHKDDNTEEGNTLGSFFAFYSQEYESRIVETLMCYLVNYTDLMKVDGTPHPVGSYEYDGFKMLKENVDRYEGGLDAVLELLNEKTLELTGFRLEWAHKPLDQVRDLTKWLDEVTALAKPDEEFVRDMAIINDACKRNDVGTIETLLKIHPNRYIYSVDPKGNGDEGTWYGWNGKRWEKSEIPIKQAIQYAVPDYWRGLLAKWESKYDPNKIPGVELSKVDQLDGNQKLFLTTSQHADVRIGYLLSHRGLTACFNNAKSIPGIVSYTLEFDTNPDLFGCENGVLDFNEECFRPYRFDDYVSMSCGYDVTPFIPGFKVVGEDGICRVIGEDGELHSTTEEEEFIQVVVDGHQSCWTSDAGNGVVYVEADEESLGPRVGKYVNGVFVRGPNLAKEEYDAACTKISSVFEQIMPNIDERTFLFVVLGSGLSGLPIAKFHIFNGDGRNGKGLTNESMAKVLGQYCVNVSSSIFYDNPRDKSSGSANPEIAKLDKKRYVITKEPPSHVHLQNSVVKDLTGGGETCARMLFSSKSLVQLFLTMVLEANNVPTFAEEPVDADVERIVDIRFGSLFTADEAKWDKTTGRKNHIYPLDVELKHTMQTTVYKNAFLNILLYHLLMLKAKKYNIDAFRPRSVLERSQAYLQKSFDIHMIFIELFEKRQEDRANLYRTFRGEQLDEDWTDVKIAERIRKSEQFKTLSKYKKAQFTKEAIIKFFKTNVFYREAYYEDTHNHAWRLRDWRLRLSEDEENYMSIV